MTAGPARFLAAYDAMVDRWPGPADLLDLRSGYGTTRVIACGPADAEPLVLLHGAGTTAAAWFANAAGLSRTRRLYAVDRIGEPGRSVRGGHPPGSAADLLGWLDGVLDGLGVGRADLCGHSYGGWLALSYTRHAPERVRKLVLLDPTQCFAGYRAGYLLHALPVLLRPTADRARAFLAWETRAAPTDPQWRTLYGLAAEFPQAKAVTGRRLRPGQLREVTTPTLVLLAGDSRAHRVHRAAAAALRQLPHVETAVLAGVSHHGMPAARASALDGMILGFLDKP